MRCAWAGEGAEVCVVSSTPGKGDSYASLLEGGAGGGNSLTGRFSRVRPCGYNHAGETGAESLMSVFEMQLRQPVRR